MGTWFFVDPPFFLLDEVWRTAYCISEIREGEGDTFMIPARFRTIAVVAPAGRLVDEAFDAGVDRLVAAGKEVRIAGHARGPSPVRYLSAPAAERAADLAGAWLDSEVDLILCARGGFGSSQLLELLDWNALARRPDLPLVGYSDITALHFAMETRGVGTPVCGPMLGKLDVAAGDRWTANHFAGALECIPRELDHEVGIISTGRAVGCPLVGNLTVAAAMCGTGFLPSAAGRIIVLEDLNEPVYKIDRCLTQLRLAGFFRNAAAVAFGKFSDCAPAEELEELFRRFAKAFSGPVVTNFPFGHVFPLVSMNFRQRMVLDTAEGIRFI